MNPIQVDAVTDLQVLLTLVGSGLGAILAGLVAFSLWVSWRRSEYRFLGALTIFFAALTLNQALSTATSLAYFLDPSKLLVIPGFEVRQTIFTLAIAFVFYSLWRRNGKVEKAIHAARAVEEHKTSSTDTP